MFMFKQIRIHVILAALVALPITLAEIVPTLTQSVVLPGLVEPWDLSFLPSGDLLYTEKCKGLSIRFKNATTVFLFGIGAALDAPDVFCEGQSGVLGVTVDPEFTSNRFIYTFVASTLGSPNPNATSPATNHVVRLKLSEGMNNVTDRLDIVTDIPFKNEATPSGDAGAHSGGRIRFSPLDGFLYITTGDNHSPTIPQDTSSLGSCVVRVDRDGEAAPDNNMPASADQRIFTYGHRNVQGIAFRPGAAFEAQPFTAEHGPNHSDEVTPLVPGGNAGWDPQDRPDLLCPAGYCGYAGTPETMPMTDTDRFPDAMLPAWVWDGAKRGMGPAEFLEGPQWGDWEGDLVVGLMADKSIFRLTLDADGNATSSLRVPGIPQARYRSIIQGPEGALYAVVDEPPALWKLTPSGAVSVNGTAVNGTGTGAPQTPVSPTGGNGNSTSAAGQGPAEAATGVLQDVTGSGITLGLHLVAAAVCCCLGLLFVEV